MALYLIDNNKQPIEIVPPTAHSQKPDVSRKVIIATGTINNGNNLNAVAPNDGWFKFSANISNNDNTAGNYLNVSVFVNSEQIFQEVWFRDAGWNFYSGNWGIFPVSKGETISIRLGGTSNNRAWSTAPAITFYPDKGA